MAVEGFVMVEQIHTKFISLGSFISGSQDHGLLSKALSSAGGRSEKLGVQSRRQKEGVSDR